MCTRSYDESLMYLLVFTWKFLNLVMWIDMANGLPACFFFFLLFLLLF